MSKPTPTPWSLNKDEKGITFIQGNTRGWGWDHLAEVDTSGDAPEIEANAAHIVHCVNMHDELVAALQTLEIEAEGYGELYTPGGIADRKWKATLARVRKVLVKAGAK